MKSIKARRRLLPLLLAVVAALVVQATVHAAAPSGSSFPVTVRAANGAITFAKAPQRIISLSPSATEDLFAVGAGKQVIAVDSYSNYPKTAPRTKLSGYTPNIEAIAGYKPDLVVISNDMSHIVAQLGKLHIPVLVEPAPANLDAAYAEIAQIGQATGHADQAALVVKAMKRQVAQIVASTPKPTKRLSVYHELDQTLYSVTSHTFIGQMYTLLGIDNVADKAGGTGDYPQLSGEYIIASSPDLIVLADTVCCGQKRSTVATRPGWGSIKAVRSGSIVAIDDSIASEWGPRVVLFLKGVASAVKTLEASQR